jgi:hypothetical protein
MTGHDATLLRQLQHGNLGDGGSGHAALLDFVCDR